MPSPIFILVVLFVVVVTCTVVGICVLKLCPGMPVSVVNLVLFNLGAIPVLFLSANAGPAAALFIAAIGGRLMLLSVSGGQAILNAGLEEPELD